MQTRFLGTILNTVAVIVGSLIGLAFANVLPASWQSVALTGLGLVTFILGVKMALQSRNMLIVAGSIAVGGILGAALGISPALASLAEQVRHSVGGGGRFTEGLLTTTLLYCVGPMTIMGCLQDGLEGKIDILAMKSLLDGIASVFFAAALGVGVLVSAVAVFIVQGALTLLAKRLSKLADNEEAMAELTGVGGALLLCIGLGLAEIKHIPTETYLPALILAPVAVIIGQRWGNRQAQNRPN
ncbi:MAG: DUF554 domain-containing protein [Chthonomonas sp.]|nr:DUF554 domain-containing protein [Chthonomonas sp.]